MFGLDTLVFAAPAALAALALLPIIWWLLRHTPPRPASVRFPPYRLLLALISREEESDRTPLWLVLLRLAIAALIILAVAQPLLNAGGSGARAPAPVLLVVDDGWMAAADWRAREQALQDVIGQAERGNQPVALATTAPRATAQSVALETAHTARQRAAALQPRALDPDRAGLTNILKAALGDVPALRVVWLADGIDYGQAAAFAAMLGELASGNATLEVVKPPTERLPPALHTPRLEDGNLVVSASRVPHSAPASVTVQLTALNGRNLADVDLTFDAGQDRAEGQISLPLELRNLAAALRIADVRNAGAAYLVDDRWRRKTVSLLSGTSLELEQPLLSPFYYVARALEPTAHVDQIRDSSDLINQLDAGLSMLILADLGIIPGVQRKSIREWVERGGVLVRFAGPRLAGGQDDLVPVRLRSGGRSLGSALSWEQPQRLSPFASDGPFDGLVPDDEVRVSRQVLAEPSPDLAGKVWASLEDGTPLITAAKRGNGLIVLFHTTANTDWSNLPLSGLFVDLLSRIVDLAPGAGTTDGAGEAGDSARADTAGAFVPLRTLNGFGALTLPPAEAAPLPAAALSDAKPAPLHPAGLYSRGASVQAVNVDTSTVRKTIEALPAGIEIRDYTPAPVIPLAGYLFTFAFLLFLADCLAALIFSGAWQRVRSGRAAMAAVLLALLVAAVPDSAPLAQSAGLSAADQFAMRSALDTRIAFVRTGLKEVDDVSFSGLRGLNMALRERTSVEPTTPAGIDIETDEIVFFPLVYWPVLPGAPPLSAKAVAKIDNYMKNGGTIFFDTRDDDTDLSGLTGVPGPAAVALRTILADLDIPALEPVPPEHVLTKAFYLLQSFPGRYAGGLLWVEAGDVSAETGNADGVTSIIIGANDYAAAWARDLNGRPMFPVVPGGPRQREFAIRSGINIVVYVLTGNYKADQVHVPALLERLGQ